MTEPMVTFEGKVTLSEAKRLVAAAEATVQSIAYVQLVSCLAEDDPTIYRVQPDGVTHFVGPTGEWEPLGYPWPLGRVNGHDVYVVTEADALRQQAERTPPVWTPKVDEWVQHRERPWEKVRKVVEVYRDFARLDGESVYHNKHNLVKATAEEIATAKRIVVKAGMLLKRHSDGVVLVIVRRSGATAVSGWLVRDITGRDYRGQWGEPDTTLTTDHYTVLPEYTVKGVV